MKAKFPLLILLVLLSMCLVAVYGEASSLKCPPGTFLTNHNECKPGVFETVPNCTVSCSSPKTEKCEDDEFYSSQKKGCLPCSICSKIPVAKKRHGIGCHKCEPASPRPLEENCADEQFYNKREKRCFACSLCDGILDEAKRANEGCTQCDPEFARKRCPDGQFYNTRAKKCFHCSLCVGISDEVKKENQGCNQCVNETTYARQPSHNQPTTMPRDTTMFVRQERITESDEAGVGLNPEAEFKAHPDVSGHGVPLSTTVFLLAVESTVIIFLLVAIILVLLKYHHGSRGGTARQRGDSVVNINNDIEGQREGANDVCKSHQESGPPGTHPLDAHIMKTIPEEEEIDYITTV